MSNISRSNDYNSSHMHSQQNRRLNPALGIIGIIGGSAIGLTIVACGILLAAIPLICTRNPRILTVTTGMATALIIGGATLASKALQIRF